MNGEYKTEQQLQYIYGRAIDIFICNCGKKMAKANITNHYRTKYHIDNRATEDNLCVPTPVHPRPLLTPQPF